MSQEAQAVSSRVFTGDKRFFAFKEGNTLYAPPIGIGAPKFTMQIDRECFKKRPAHEDAAGHKYEPEKIQIKRMKKAVAKEQGHSLRSHKFVTQFKGSF